MQEDAIQVTIGEPSPLNVQMSITMFPIEEQVAMFKDLYKKEDLSQYCDSVNDEFSLNYPPFLESLLVMQNGLAQVFGSDEDYEVDENIIIFDIPPFEGDKLVVSYIRDS